MHTFLKTMFGFLIISLFYCIWHPVMSALLKFLPKGSLETEDEYVRLNLQLSAASFVVVLVLYSSHQIGLHLGAYLPF